MFVQLQVNCNECGGRSRVLAREGPAYTGQKVPDYMAQFPLDMPRGAPEDHEVVFF